MIVYRYEDEHGDGLYSCGEAIDILIDTVPGDHATRHPTPRNDQMLVECIYHRTGAGVESFLSECMIFGFSSVEQMRKWIPKRTSDEIEKLTDIRLKVFEVPNEHVYCGGHQCVFESHMAVEIE